MDGIHAPESACDPTQLLASPSEFPESSHSSAVWQLRLGVERKRKGDGNEPAAWTLRSDDHILKRAQGVGRSKLDAHGAA